MAVALAALSFTCAFFIAIFIPVKRIRTSIPHLAIVLWLGGYNIVHGINAIVWAGNLDIHIPVWCDIVTKLMLGANIALPGALLCIAIQLQLVSSSKKISTNPTVLRNRTILELFLCYIIPLIYMSSHLIVQHHRFDIVKDLGCSASTHPSTIGFLVTWLPPVLTCSIVFVFSGVSAHNASRTVSFADHLQSRSSMDPSLFFRRLATCVILTGALCILSFSALFSVPKSEPWTSWASVHALMNQVNIVQVQENVDPTEPHGDLTSIQVAWWGIFVVSVVYILQSFTIGEEARDAFRWIGEQVTRKRDLPRRLVLPIYNSNKQPSSPMSEMVARSPSLTKPQPRPLTIELKSGWDDALDEKRPKRKTSKSPSPTFCSTPTPSNRSVSPSNKSITDEDQAFMASTLSYLGSPTAKTLGIAPPIQIPLPAQSPLVRRTLEIPPRPTSPPPIPTPKSIMKPAPKFVPEDVEPTLSSVLHAAWPIPPVSPTPSLPSSRHGTRSRSHSPASSAEETIGYPLYPTITPPHRRTGRPFEGSSISSFVVPDAPPASPAPSNKMTSAMRPTIQTLRRSWSKERLGQGLPANEVIRMTVVQETV
ncbi:pheromone A receptor-domain-containing protein [Flammula alnicola]|nr:pheromone A receptor-domain-containing protein [Flammula alnicola]